MDLADFEREPFKTLDRVRANVGSVYWRSAGSEGLIGSEQQADEVIEHLREVLPACYVEHGIRPLVAVDGMASYEKYVVLRVDAKQKQRVRAQIARQVGCEATDVGALEDASRQDIRRI
jgi:hypothetical protein